jgi:hypothetical protein
MIFSEDDNSYTLAINPLNSLEQINSGLWLVLVGVNEIPPHIALISEGKYYSLSTHKVDCGTLFERFLGIIERKQMPALFIRIMPPISWSNNVIARNEAISSNASLNLIYQNLQPLSNNQLTCFSPIKRFFTETFSHDFADVNYAFELLSLAEKKGMLKECVSLFCKETNSKSITLPKYTSTQIRNRIEELSSRQQPLIHP